MLAVSFNLQTNQYTVWCCVKVKNIVCDRLAHFLRVKSRTVAPAPRVDPDDPAPTPGNSSTDLLLAAINEKMANRLDNDSQRRETKNEWRVAAAVIDRLCLFVFLTIFLVVSIVLFMCAAFAMDYSTNRVNSTCSQASSAVE